jgi:hypothetical protein
MLKEEKGIKCCNMTTHKIETLTLVATADAIPVRMVVMDTPSTICEGNMITLQE